MENTGMDLGLWPLYAMLAIVFGFMVAGGLDIMNWILYPIVWILAPLEYFMSDKPDVQEEELELIIEPPKRDKPEKDEVLSESDWDTICAQAVKQAKQGDASARNWVTKNILEKESEKLVADELKTDVTIVSETVEALVSLGWKKGDATKEVKEAACAKEYKSVEELLVFIHKKK